MVRNSPVWQLANTKKNWDLSLLSGPALFYLNTNGFQGLTVHSSLNSWLLPTCSKFGFGPAYPDPFSTLILLASKDLLPLVCLAVGYYQLVSKSDLDPLIPKCFHFNSIGFLGLMVHSLPNSRLLPACLIQLRTGPACTDSIHCISMLSTS